MRLLEFETILHHTVRNENPDKVESDGPFPVENIKGAYLGAGYYFWDDHIDLAHWWGEKHCNKDYIICQADFVIKKEDFCDLVGSRQDQNYISSMFSELEATHLNLGQLIELLKDLEARPNIEGYLLLKLFAL